MLKDSTPYMLRNDGKVFEIESYRPYIIRPDEDADDNTLSFLMDTDSEFWCLKWFYDNTLNPVVKNDIRILIKSFVYHCKAQKSFIEGDILTNTEEIYKQFNIIDKTTLLEDPNDIYEMLIKINNDVNQEFCRFRTSDMIAGKYDTGIYFRISSIGFNWFDLIWQIAYDNRKHYSDITIVRDGDKFKAYVIDGERIFNYDIEDFITLGGHPIVEKYDNNALSMLSSGKTITESTGYIGMYNLNRTVRYLKQKYYKDNFRSIDEQ